MKNVWEHGHVVLMDHTVSLRVLFEGGVWYLSMLKEDIYVYYFTLVFSLLGSLLCVHEIYYVNCFKLLKECKQLI